MMKYFLFLLLMPLTIQAQNGSIAGNVFYKYNDFVGNRPDAGATVKVFPLANPASFKKATVDLQGNFAITNLDTGKHLVIVISKETNQDPYLGYFAFVVYGKYIDKYFGFNPKTIDTALQNAIESKHQEYFEYGVTKKANFKKIEKTKTEIMEMVFKFFNELPLEKMVNTGITLPTDNFQLQELVVNDKPSEKLIIDFGISDH
jgi:hypothetical protein